MKHSTSFSTLLDDIGFACKQVLRVLARAVRDMAALPWPALLAACILIALAITIVPLALTLFVLFMLLKFAVAAIVVDKRRHGG